MLGLRYGVVELAAYRAEWAHDFTEERARLSNALRALPCRIEHVGSTAVLDLCAKPILDIAVGIPADLALEAVFSAIEAAEYRYRGDAGPAGGHVFVRESHPATRTHHLHLVRLTDPQWEKYLLLRDFLISSRLARESYMEEKRLLAARYPADRKAYSEAKGTIISRLIAEALCCSHIVPADSTRAPFSAARALAPSNTGPLPTNSGAGRR